MERFKTLTLIGGISVGSLNQRLFRAIEALSLPDFEFIETGLTSLPYFSQDLEIDPPDSVTEFKEKIRDANCVLFITPEYNRSFPGVLKNAIDWGSRPYGDNLWAGMPAALMGASIGSIGTFGAQHHLRQVLSYLDMPVLNRPEVYLNASDMFTAAEKFREPSTVQFIEGFFHTFREFIEKIETGVAGEAPINRRGNASSGLSGLSNH